jgi:hypothetical protein
MMSDNNREQRWDQLAAEYRAACPDMDGGADFMPGVWRRIEAKRSQVFAWTAMSRRVLAAAVAICCLFAVVMSSSLQSSLTVAGTYIETLDDDDSNDDLASLHPASYSAEMDRE